MVINCSRCDRIFEDGEKLMRLTELIFQEDYPESYHFKYPEENNGSDYLCGECWIDLQRSDLTE